MSVHINELPKEWKPVLAVDIEATGLDPFVDHILMVAVFDGEDYWLYLHTHGFNCIKGMLEDENILKILQNAKYDMKMLKQQKNIEIKNVYDVMIADAVIYMGLKYPMDLKSIIARHCGEMVDKEEVESFINHPGFDKRPVTEEQIEYVCNDVKYLHGIREAQLVLISNRKLGRVIALEFEIIPAIVELELGGLRLDVDMWFEQMEFFNTSIAEHETAIKDLIGRDYVLKVPATKKGEKYLKDVPCEEINLRSNPHMVAIYQDRFGLPLDANNEKVLSAYQEEFTGDNPDGDKLIEYILNIKKWNKRLGYRYHEFVHPLTKKVHPSFYQVSTFTDKNHGTVTGRLACSDPNMQQVPRPTKGEPNMRQLWTADSEEYIIIAADYAQQEPRIFAQLSKDTGLIQACNEEDVYIACGKLAYNEDIDKHDPRRHIMKTCMLSSFYGAGTGAMHKNSGLPEEECGVIRDFIREKFPVAANFGKKMEAFATTYNHVYTALGRRRYGQMSYMESVNAPVQGTAADMFKMALLRIYTVLTEEKKCGKLDVNTRVWNMVHDEIEVHAHKDQAEYVAGIVKREMEAAAHILCPDVKHIAEVSWGYRWDKG